MAEVIGGWEISFELTLALCGSTFGVNTVRGLNPTHAYSSNTHRVIGSIPTMLTAVNPVRCLIPTRSNSSVLRSYISSYIHL